MIEIKLSQGAKPGHGGILPAAKNTPEIAAIRDVEPYTDVISPPSHTAFSTPVGLCEFIQKLRMASGLKPIGFKLCVGKWCEFIALCKAMHVTGIKPDFITVDGGEGGTGAAPPEYSNSVGFPLHDGLPFVADALISFDLRREIRIICSGKIISGFHMARALATGADMTNSARGMMLALGCIQALECNRNSCPTGITTQNPGLMAGLFVSDKTQRIYNFHRQTVKSLAELLTAAGLELHPGERRGQSRLFLAHHLQHRVVAHDFQLGLGRRLHPCSGFAPGRAEEGVAACGRWFGLRGAARGELSLHC